MYVYMIGAYASSGRLNYLKVGMAEDVISRIKGLQTGNINELRPIFAWKQKCRNDAFSHEQRVFNDCRGLLARGEWFYARSYRKVLSHLVRQMGVPNLQASVHGVSMNPYSGDACIDGILSESIKPKKKIQRSIRNRSNKLKGFWNP